MRQDLVRERRWRRVRKNTDKWLQRRAGDKVKIWKRRIPVFQSKRRVAAFGPVGEFLDALQEKLKRTVESPMPENSTQTELRAVELE